MAEESTQKLFSYIDIEFCKESIPLSYHGTFLTVLKLILNFLSNIVAIALERTMEDEEA